MLSAGFKIMIVGVAAYGMDESYLGKIIDEDIYERLLLLEEQYRINVSGEGGEYETFVVDAPIFRYEIIVDDMEKIWDGMRGEIRIKSLHLDRKIF